MSFYRSLVVAAATLGLASAVFAADENMNATPNSAAPDSAKAVQVASNTDDSTQGTEAKVNLNTASVKDLLAVKGLNPAKAKAIVMFRKKHGDFKSVDDLKMVKGFKKMKEDSLKQIMDQLTV